MVYDPIPDYDNVLAMVSLYPGQDCKAAATYMQVLQQGDSEVAIMAHEFMHMIQRSYNPAVECFDPWWKESTANWAIDYFEAIDPAADSQAEHGYAEAYLESTHRQLVDVGEGDDIREYGAYLWPFYLSHYTGSYRPQLIAEIYAATEVAGKGNLYKSSMTLSMAAGRRAGPNSPPSTRIWRQRTCMSSGTSSRFAGNRGRSSARGRP